MAADMFFDNSLQSNFFYFVSFVLLALFCFRLDKIGFNFVTLGRLGLGKYTNV